MVSREQMVSDWYMDTWGYWLAWVTGHFYLLPASLGLGAPGVFVDPRVERKVQADRRAVQREVYVAAQREGAAERRVRARKRAWDKERGVAEIRVACRGSFSGRSLEILVMRGEGMTLKAIGDEVGLSHERVRQIVVKGEFWLRDRCREVEVLRAAEVSGLLEELSRKV